MSNWPQKRAHHGAASPSCYTLFAATLFKCCHVHCNLRSRVCKCDISNATFEFLQAAARVHQVERLVQAFKKHVAEVNKELESPSNNALLKTDRLLNLLQRYGM